MYPTFGILGFQKFEKKIFDLSVTCPTIVERTLSFRVDKSALKMPKVVNFGDLKKMALVKFDDTKNFATRNVDLG